MKTIKTKNSLLVVTYFFLLASYTITNAQSNMPIQWQACFGGTDRDNVTDMAATENGYLLCARVHNSFSVN